MLKDLYQANLFVLPLDEEGQWFRYHHLFADLLQARLRHSLSPDAIAVLHQRAAVWYEQSDMVPEAIDHALAAKDYSHAVQLIGKVALPMVLQAYVRTVDGWLRSIPQEYPEQSPQLMMAFAWLHLLRGDFAGATPYLERLTAIFSIQRWATRIHLFWVNGLPCNPNCFAFKGSRRRAATLANRALQILPEADAHVRNMVYINLATAYEQMLDYDRAAETFQMIVRDARATGNFAFEILGISGQAQMLLQQGQLHPGFEIASQGVHRLEERRKINSL